MVADSGDTLLSMPTTGLPVTVTPLDVSTLPFTSKSARSGERDGHAVPRPQRNTPLGVSNPSGEPRTPKPAKPDTSAFSAISLLTMKSPKTSALPVLTPADSLPVGSFTMNRTAIAEETS